LWRSSKEDVDTRHKAGRDEPMEGARFQEKSGTARRGK
jgi:hypothetical protein